jgi:hypothetical protein
VTEFRAPNPDWTSFCQLIQQLIAGNVRRNTFTQWEMELLLDLQMVYMRKSSRPEMLRRYLRAVQRQMASGAAAPERFTSFFETESQLRKTLAGLPQEMLLRRAS